MKPAAQTWSVQEAKARLSELLRRARAGTPQRIGTAGEPCVLVSEQEWQNAGQPKEHLGRWLVAHTPRGTALEQPSRSDKRPANPFKRAR
jgi:prevent-host-death family protein